MSAQSALSGTSWTATHQRTRAHRAERAAVPTGWGDPLSAIEAFVWDPTKRVPGPSVGSRVARRRERSAPRSAGRVLLRATLLFLVLGIVATAAASFPYLRWQEELDRAEAAEARAAAAGAELEASGAAAAHRTARMETMRGRIARLEAEMLELELSKVKTVVETETVTEEVVRWVPNGEAVTVEITGFEGLIGVHDVQITHSYGFTDIVGIAVNESGHTISYAQLGCTFLAEDGTVLANAITNKQGWAPDQSWGFTCSAQVDATGGILRVDEMS